MAYKLIAVDIDDTLLNRKKEITPKTKEALLKAQEKGVKLVVASGRLPYGVRPFAKELNVLENGGFYMGFNGGAILNSKEEVIGKTYLDSKYIKPVYDELRDYNVTTMLHNGNIIYADKKVNKYTDVETKAVGIPLTLVDDLPKIVDFDVHKFLIAGEPEELKDLEKHLLDKFGDELDIYLSAPWFLEIMPKGISKGLGLKALCDYTGIDMKDVIACGDNYNDISMVSMAGLGVAMANAEEELKAVADYVTINDCDNDGLAEVVEKFIL
jgi:hypothetical protein